MGGPGFYLFNLEQTAHSPHYYYHKFDPEDEKSHRRSIYRFVVRSQPNPFMTTLDCADSSQSTPRRNETLTALASTQSFEQQVHAWECHSILPIGWPKKVKGSAIRFKPALNSLPVARQMPKNITCLVQYAEKHGMANLCRSLFSLSEFAFID